MPAPLPLLCPTVPGYGQNHAHLREQHNQRGTAVAEKRQADAGVRNGIAYHRDIQDNLYANLGLSLIHILDDSTGEELLVQIEDDELFEEIAGIFEERLADLFEIEEMEGNPEEPLQ